MLVAYSVAIELVRQLRPIVDQIKMHDAHLADQLKRAATNTVANLAEGQRRVAGNKRRAFENAHGEAREMLGCLDCALAWGYATDDGAARKTLDRLLGLCWGPHALTRARTPTWEIGQTDLPRGNSVAREETIQRASLDCSERAVNFELRLRRHRCS